MNEFEEGEDAGTLAVNLSPFLQTQLRMIDCMLHRLGGGEDGYIPSVDPQVAAITVLLIQAAGTSTHSLLQLTQTRSMSIRDCFGIARSISELAVNASYIATGGPDIAKRARLHALQRSYRDLERKGVVGGFGFELRRSSKPQVAQVPELADALSEFTRTNGREVMEWTPLSVSERIEVVRTQNSKAALSLAGSVTAVYRHSSDVLHGTYSGAVHFWQASGTPTTTRERFYECWDEHYTSIFTATYFGLHGLVDLFAALLDLPELLATQNRLDTELAGRLTAMGLTSPSLVNDGV